MDAYERHLMLEEERRHDAYGLPRECIECGDPADDRELCDTCAVQEVTSAPLTCRCGAPANVGTVDLCDFLCTACYEHFDEWVTEHRDALGKTLVFADWPGRTAVAA